MKIHILGPGCKRCVSTEHNTRRALEELQVDAQVIKIEDPTEFMRWNVMFTPALIVDDEVLVSGRVPTVEEIKGWIQSRLKTDASSAG